MPLPRRPGPQVRSRVHVHEAGHVRAREDRLATEEPLEVRLSWPGHDAQRLAVTMRTPGHDFELAAGLLHGEGVIDGADDVHTVAYCTDETLTPEEEFNVVTVTLTREPRVSLRSRYDGVTAGSSACGVCGTTSIGEALATCARDRPGSPGTVAASVVLSLPVRLREAQRTFETTGGLHAAGLFEYDGSPLAVREDIGRHNAVDKVVGWQLLQRRPSAPVLCVSGRIGFEIVQKALAAGVEVLAAVGAPSSLAVSLAREAGLCVVGFVRRDRYVAYTEPSRVGA